MQGKGAPEIFFTFGDEEKLRSPKAVFFLRAGDKLDLEKAGDGQLMMGEIAGDPLSSLEVSIAELYGKFSSERTEWGKASDEVREEFKSEIEHVSGALSTALVGVKKALQLEPVPEALEIEETLRVVAPRGGVKPPKKSALELEYIERCVPRAARASAPLTALP